VLSATGEKKSEEITTWWLVPALIDQTAEEVIQSAEFPFESPFQPPREMEGQELAHVE
jgi:hypothetical protein